MIHLNYKNTCLLYHNISNKIQYYIFRMIQLLDKCPPCPSIVQFTRLNVLTCVRFATRLSTEFLPLYLIARRTLEINLTSVTSAIRLSIKKVSVFSIILHLLKILLTNSYIILILYKCIKIVCILNKLVPIMCTYNTSKVYLKCLKNNIKNPMDLGPEQFKIVLILKVAMFSTEKIS